MSAFKSHKRKSIKTESESPTPKAIKLETPNKSPKQQNKKTPKGVNQQQGTPFVKSENKNTPNQAATPKPKLEMFKGTGKLDLKTPNNTPATGKKNFKPPRTESEIQEIKQNRHKKRRALTKEKRREQRVKFTQLKTNAIEGSEEAKKEVQLKIAALESDGALSKTKKRKLAILKRILNKDGPRKTAVAVQQNKKKEVQVPKNVATNVQKKQNGKGPQLKKQVVVPKKEQEVEEEDDDDDDIDDEVSAEEDGDSAEDEEESGDEEDDDDEEGSAEDEEGEESDDEDAQEDEDDEDDESDEKPTEVAINKKPAQVQKNKPDIQKSKPVKQAAPPSTPPSGPPKQSRHVVFVGNIAYTSTSNDLREHFKNVGEIVDIRIPSNQDGKPRGFAYVELKDEAAYQKALSLNHSTLGGRKINVLYSEGGKKKTDQQKSNIKARNFQQQGRGRGNQGNTRGQNRSPWRGRGQQRGR